MNVHIRLFDPDGGWVTLLSNDDPLRIVKCLEGLPAVVSYTGPDGQECVEETATYQDS